jgi:histidine kinase
VSAWQWRVWGSYLLVALVALGALALTAELASGAFYRDHLNAMSTQFGGAQPDAMHAQLEAGFARALHLSLVVGALVGGVAALVVGALAARRVLHPVAQLSRAAARIAAGGYSERLPGGGRDELGRLGEEFNRMAGALEASEAKRVELIGNVAHELRTPLHALQGYAEGLEDGVFGVTEASNAVRREVRRLERVVGDLAAVSNAEAGALALRCETLDFGGLLAELVQANAGNVDGRLTFDPPAHPVRVWADRDRVAQIVLNLLGNAARYAPGCPVRLELQLEPLSAILSVIDDGPGIAPEHLPHIFERFYRADPARGDGGSGVGLTISRSLARAMHGELSATSALGEGTRFSLRLPLATNRAGSQPTPVRPRAANPRDPSAGL